MNSSIPTGMRRWVSKHSLLSSCQGNCLTRGLLDPDEWNEALEYEEKEEAARLAAGRSELKNPYNHI